MFVETVGNPWMWAGFGAFVITVLTLDLGVFHRRAHTVSLREAAAWTLVWVSLALVFNAGVWHFAGAQKGLEFFTGYLIEKSLSVDNVFVFAMLFSYFAVPPLYQHKVLFWGILGAIIMRSIFILAGAALLAKFHWIIYVFGGILVMTGVKLFVQRSAEMNPEKNWVLRVFRRLVPSVPEYHGQRFLVMKNGRRFATPLLGVLVAVEATDLIFAVDSIPAVFAVTRDPFIVYTSNIFAILGLRAMYFLLAGVMDRFAYLKPGLAMVLVFVGTKMMLTEIYKIPIGVSLGVVAGILAVSIAASIIVTGRQQRAAQLAAAALPPEA